MKEQIFKAQTENTEIFHFPETFTGQFYVRSDVLSAWAGYLATKNVGALNFVRTKLYFPKSVSLDDYNNLILELAENYSLSFGGQSDDGDDYSPMKYPVYTSEGMSISITGSDFMANIALRNDREGLVSSVAIELAEIKDAGEDVIKFFIEKGLKLDFSDESKVNATFSIINSRGSISSHERSYPKLHLKDIEKNYHPD
ncbi:MAG: hypothetical protein AABY22_36035, partial [Nanoarchaeota archaeon]